MPGVVESSNPEFPSKISGIDRNFGDGGGGCVVDGGASYGRRTKCDLLLEV